MVGIQPLGAEHYGKFAAFLTVIAQQKTLGSKVVEPDRFLASQAMRPAEHHIETLIEQLPAVETIPGFANGCADGELGVARFQVFHNLRTCAAQDLQLNFTETFSQLVDVR